MPGANLATENQEDGFISPASSYGCCNDCKKCDCNTKAYGGVGSRCREGAKISSGWYHTCVVRGGCDVQCAWTTSDCVSGQASNWYAPGTSCFCPSCVRPHEIECFGYGAWGNAISPPGKFKLVSLARIRHSHRIRFSVKLSIVCCHLLHDDAGCDGACRIALRWQRVSTIRAGYTLIATVETCWTKL